MDWTEIFATEVAIVSDIHGNREAYEAILADLEENPVDAVVYAGDYALFGDRPAEVVKLVRRSGAPAIVGNTDEYVVEASKGPISEWTRARLHEDDLRWIVRLPFGCWIRPAVDSTDVESLALVHATPADVEATLILDEDPFGDRELTPAEDARAMMAGLRANLVVHGHIHLAQQGEIDGQRVASVGSVGFPFDGDQRAAYAVARFEDGNWTLEHRRVAYDFTSVANRIADSATPLCLARAERIRQARALPLEE